MNIFERAIRKKLRFNATRGLLTSEDLFDLDLKSLDSLAKSVNRAVKANEEESFIEEKTAQASDDELRLEILKHVISAKLAAKDAASKRAANQARVARLKEKLADKEDEALDAKSADEIKKEIAELEEASA